jgi:hypothetical protein
MKEPIIEQHVGGHHPTALLRQLLPPCVIVTSSYILAGNFNIGTWMQIIAQGCGLSNRSF